MPYTITGRRAHLIQSRGALDAKKASAAVKAMLDDGFDVVSVIDFGNRPVTVESLLERADAEVPDASPDEFAD